MKWAIIGLGFISPRHRQAIGAVGDEVSLTCDIDASKNPDFVDWRKMTQSEAWKDISAVSLCVPNYLHCEMAIAMKDKIVLSEKPLTLSSRGALNLPDNVFTVLQLRHHPEVVRLKNESRDIKKVKLVVRVKRDLDYWQGWKGQDGLSGGILFNLGIHYFDLLIYLLGNKYRLKFGGHSQKEAIGQLNFGKTKCDYYFEIMDNNKEQERYLEIDGEKFTLSKQDNLSFEDLHIKVYQDLKRGVGVQPAEAVKSIKLVEKLKYG